MLDDLPNMTRFQNTSSELYLFNGVVQVFNSWSACKSIASNKCTMIGVQSYKWRPHVRGYFTHKQRAVTVTLWEPKRKFPKAIHDTSKIMWCGHGLSSVVWHYMWPGPQPNDISMIPIHAGFSHMIKCNKSMVVRFQSAMVSQFCENWPTSSTGLWK